VWTPRRVGLMLLGVVLLAAAFAVYAVFLGGYDGLPALPAKYLVRGYDGERVVYPVSNTVGRLQAAFGPGSPEGTADVRVYKHRLPIADRNGVMAIGTPLTDGSPRVVVSPVSVALFGPPAVRVRPGEQVEMTTMHADRAIITFDRPIERIEDMYQAKMAELQLESDPDDDPKALAETKRDPRQGQIWVTNNRKSPDPADHLVLRTRGPLFVQLPSDDAPEVPGTKHIWTTAPVEVFDRRNLPRKLRSRPDSLAARQDQTPLSAVGELLEPNPIPPVAAAVLADDQKYHDDLRKYVDDLRQYNAVSDILAGRTLPPPTAIGRGLEVYLAPAKKDPNAPKRGNSFSGVHDIVLGEGVVMCLWTDGNAGFPGGSRADPPKPAAPGAARPPSPNADPPFGLLALGGGLIDGGTLAERFEKKSLLVINTPGAFRYDLEKNYATFDAAAIAPEGGQNFVVVTRLNARNQTDDLICTRLELDMNDPDQPKGAGGPAIDGGGLFLRQITATGPQVYLSAQADGIEASCVKLVHTQDTKGRRSVTVLTGTTEVPVRAKQTGNTLIAGDALTPAVVTLTAADPPPGTPNPQRTTTVAVAGPGRMELIDRDPDTGALKSSVAQWAKRLDHEKWPKGGRTLDLFKFQENAAFVDPASNFSLRAADIWLWVANPPPGDKAAKSSATAPLGGQPEQLVATADVHLDSTDLVVRKTNKLTVWFADIAPPKVVAEPEPAPVAVDPKAMPVPKPGEPAAIPPVAVDPVVAAKPGVDGPLPPIPAPAAAPPKEPIPNPIQLQADTVESWMGRYPVAPPPPPPGAPAPAKPPAPKTKYELLKARCDDNVIVHQDPDPNDPAKPANGLDITGNKLILENTPGGGGSVMTVTGGKGADGWSMVAFEDSVIYGPSVVIDQPNNTASVAGRGRLRSLTGTDLAGNDLSSPTDLIVDWSERMKFEGAKSFAVFVGGVVVQQEAKGDKVEVKVAKPQPEIVPVARREQLPNPREAGTVTTTTSLTHLWCHQLDLTLDRPVYFNQLRKNDRNKANRTPAEPKPKVKAAVAVPLPDTDPARTPGERYVIYREQSVTPTGELTKARLLTARQMDFKNETKRQELFATGPGELRLLQQSKSDGGDKAKPNQPPEMKLTLVTFQKTMTAVDQGNGLFQEATFEKGGVALRTPTTDLMLPLEAHALPVRSEYLRSEDELIVSSAKAKKDAEPDQRLTALGNAEFRDDRRTGLGDKIVFDGTRVTLEAGLGRMATLYSNKRAVNQQQSVRAKKFIYNSATGVVEQNESSGGTILPGK
jgi:hypothetical protein